MPPSRENNYKNKHSITQILITYMFFNVLLLLIMSFGPIKNLIDINGIYTKFIIYLTSKVVSIMSIPCTYDGPFMRLPRLTLEVKFGCNGLEAVFMFTIAVLVFPAPWRKRIFGVIAGFIVIQIVNILRIAALAYTGVHYMKFFNIFHFYIAQGLMIAFALGLFILYLNYASRN
ncbi:hypothetical protein MCHI_003068 [Candidatus Magnetoovum chiemensis]|nr:hypothetical protein MCHI_003068 [Candidatus Magnetoovum chiemensis]